MSQTRHPSTHRVHGPTVLVVAAAALLLGACGAAHSNVQGVGPTTAPPQTLAAGSHAQTTTVDGTLRSCRTYVPAGLKGSTPVPLVVMLHGGLGSGSQAEQSCGWDASADAHGFVVAYPDGLNKAWNAGTCCGAPAKEGVNDVAFITVAGARHQWPGSGKKHTEISKLLGSDPPSTALNATDEIWAFFADHPAPT